MASYTKEQKWIMKDLIKLLIEKSKGYGHTGVIFRSILEDTLSDLEK